MIPHWSLNKELFVTNSIKPLFTNNFKKVEKRYSQHDNNQQLN